MRDRIGSSFTAWAIAMVLGIILTNSAVRAAGFVTPQEMQYKEQWAKENLLNLKARMPFSFTYGRQPSDELL
ncbi:MAG: hypothetical protein Q7T18_03465, partial [Sedimentisphaerales bacterium]|nr:hypothetical protein [Sedimentisphaerales bacterium]